MNLYSFSCLVSSLVVLRIPRSMSVWRQSLYQFERSIKLINPVLGSQSGLWEWRVSGEGGPASPGLQHHTSRLRPAALNTRPDSSVSWSDLGLSLRQSLDQCSSSSSSSVISGVIVTMVQWTWVISNIFYQSHISAVFSGVFPCDKYFENQFWFEMWVVSEFVRVWTSIFISLIIIRQRIRSATKLAKFDQIKYSLGLEQHSSTPLEKLFYRLELLEMDTV